MTDAASALPAPATEQVWVDPSGVHPAVRVPVQARSCQTGHAGCVGVQIRGVYDGVCLWEHEGGWVENRFDTPGWRESRRYQAVEDYITQNYLGWQRRSP